MKELGEGAAGFCNKKQVSKHRFPMEGKDRVSFLSIKRKERNCTLNRYNPYGLHDEEQASLSTSLSRPMGKSISCYSWRGFPVCLNG